MRQEMGCPMGHYAMVAPARSSVGAWVGGFVLGVGFCVVAGGVLAAGVGLMAARATTAQVAAESMAVEAEHAQMRAREHLIKREASASQRMLPLDALEGLTTRESVIISSEQIAPPTVEAGAHAGRASGGASN